MSSLPVVPAWPSEAEEEYYALVRGYGVPNEYLGGEPVTPVERVLLDVFAAVEDSVREYRSVLPPRYERTDMGAHRATGRLDTLLSVFSYLTGRPAQDAVRIVVELMRERGRPDEVRILEDWVRDNPDGPGVPVEPLRTLTSTESAVLARLPGLLASPALSAPVGVRLATPASASVFMTRLAQVLCQAGQSLSVSASAVAVIDEAANEVEVFAVAELPEPFADGFADAYESLMPELGAAFTAVPRPMSVPRPGRPSDPRSASY